MCVKKTKEKNYDDVDDDDEEDDEDDIGLEEN